MTLDLSVLDEASDNTPNASARGDGVPLRAPIESFDSSPSNPRFEDDDAQFQLLVEDIALRGLLQPIVVRRLNDRLQICFGSRRYRAAIAAGLTDIAYVVSEDPRQLDDYAQVAENEKRHALQPMELAVFAQRKIAGGERKKDVARRLGIHPSSLAHLLSLVDAPPPFILDLYQSGRCRTAVYLYRLRLLWKRDAAMVEAACAAKPDIDVPMLDALAMSIETGTGILDGAGPPPVASIGAMGQAESDGLHPKRARQATPANDAAPVQEPLVTCRSQRNARLLRPVVRGTWQGREFTLLIHRQPSEESRIFVSELNAATGESSEYEVPIREIVLRSLCEGGKQ